jgi:hypothetical protein
VTGGNIKNNDNTVMTRPSQLYASTNIHLPFAGRIEGIHQDLTEVD